MSKEDKESDPKKCDECGATVSEEDGRLVCKECGLDNGPAVVNDADYYPTSFDDHMPGSNTTMINVPMSPDSVDELEKSRRLKRTDIQSYTSKERNLYKLKKKAEQYCKALKIPSNLHKIVVRKCEEAKEGDLATGKPKKVVIASVIQLVSRYYSYPRLQADICNKIFGIPVSSSERTDKQRGIINTVKRLTNKISEPLGLEKPFDHPREFVNKIRSEADVPVAVARKATEFIDHHWEEGDFTGRMPQGVAGAVLLTFARQSDVEDIQVKDVSKASGVTDVTIRKVSKLVKELLEEDKDKISEDDEEGRDWIEEVKEALEKSELY